MVVSAAPVPLPLLRVIARRARPGVPYAEVWRGVGAEADGRGLTRPSYERVRLLAHELIERRERRKAIAIDFVGGVYDPLVKRGLPQAGGAVVAALEEAAAAATEYRARRRK